MNFDSENTKKEEKNARQAGFCTSIGVAGTIVLGAVTTKAFSDLPINGSEEVKLFSEIIAYSAAGSTAYGLYYTIQNAVELNFEYVAEFAKGFIAPPLLATSIYMVSENINLSLEDNEQNDKNIIIDRKSLSEDCWDREGWDHKIVCKGLEYIFDIKKEDPSP